MADILIDHAHGSGLALSLAAGDPHRAHDMREQYRLALECLLKQLMLSEQVSGSRGGSRVASQPRLMEWPPLSVRRSPKFSLWHFDAVFGRGDLPISVGRQVPMLEVRALPRPALPACGFVAGC